MSFPHLPLSSFRASTQWPLPRYQSKPLASLSFLISTALQPTFTSTNPIFSVYYENHEISRVKLKYPQLLVAKVNEKIGNCDRNENLTIDWHSIILPLPIPLYLFISTTKMGVYMHTSYLLLYACLCHYYNFHFFNL